jgi:glycosyltransferase involved in cell wall biosynthesis
VTGDRRVFVCMIAYTDYVVDARVRREAETLAAHGFHVRCLCLTTKNTPGSAPFVLDGVDVHALPIFKYRGKSTLAYIASYLQFLISASSACLRLLARGELDVVHVHNIPDFLVLAGLLPRLVGTKLVLDVHDSVPETFVTKFCSTSIVWKALCLEERLSALFAHRVICVNHSQRDTLVARGIAASKTFISMNVPDPKIFNRLSPGDRPAECAAQLNLVYHGTMAERLGVDLVIRAAAQLQSRIPCARLHLWGHGDDLAKFQRLAQELNIENTVLFQPDGFPLNELPRALRSMDVGVIGNRRTAAGDLMLPVKLLEYIALDIPVVVPRLKTIQQYFSDDMVAYYDPEDIESLTDAVYRLYREPKMRARQAARARVFLAEYGWERQGAELVSFYRSLMENKSYEQDAVRVGGVRKDCA